MGAHMVNQKDRTPIGLLRKTGLIGLPSKERFPSRESVDEGSKKIFVL